MRLKPCSTRRWKTYLRALLWSWWKNFSGSLLGIKLAGKRYFLLGPLWQRYVSCCKCLYLLIHWTCGSSLCPLKCHQINSWTVACTWTRPLPRHGSSGCKSFLVLPLFHHNLLLSWIFQWQFSQLLSQFLCRENLHLEGEEKTPGEITLQRSHLLLLPLHIQSCLIVCR